MLPQTVQCRLVVCTLVLQWQYMYTEGPPLLYTSYASPEQTKQVWHDKTASYRDKGLWMGKITSKNKNKSRINKTESN